MSWRQRAAAAIDFYRLPGRPTIARATKKGHKMSTRYPPKVPIAKLWLKTSANGNQYLLGRLGPARLIILENHNRESDSDPSHLAFVQEPLPQREED